MKALYKAVCWWITADAFRRTRTASSSQRGQRPPKAPPPMPATPPDWKAESNEFLKSIGWEPPADAGPLLYGAYRNNKTGVRRLPNLYQPAMWRGTTCVDDNHRELGVSFDMAGDTSIYLRLSVEHARHVSESIADYLRDHDIRVHSTSSSGIPRTDVS